MDSTTQSASPLRQRMLDDMRMRKLEPKTQEAYIRAVRKLAVYLKRSPDTATVEDLRNFQLHLVDTGTSPITLNATLSGLKFFFDITLGRIDSEGVVVDGRLVTWDEFLELLQPYEGWEFDLRIPLEPDW